MPDTTHTTDSASATEASGPAVSASPRRYVSFDSRPRKSIPYPMPVGEELTQFVLDRFRFATGNTEPLDQAERKAAIVSLISTTEEEATHALEEMVHETAIDAVFEAVRNSLEIRVDLETQTLRIELLPQQFDASRALAPGRLDLVTGITFHAKFGYGVDGKVHVWNSDSAPDEVTAPTVFEDVEDDVASPTT